MSQNYCMATKTQSNEFPWHENEYEILTTNLQLTIKQKALQTKTYSYKLLGIYNLT